MAIQEKYYFMGHWYLVKDVKNTLSSVTGIKEGHFKSEEDISSVIERMIKEKPSYFSAFSKEMHTLRFGTSKR
jgi:uncharacterized protein YabN with tetrapyrrole methylase and pyrophosphatase domain